MLIWNRYDSQAAWIRRIPRIGSSRLLLIECVTCLRTLLRLPTYCHTQSLPESPPCHPLYTLYFFADIHFNTSHFFHLPADCFLADRKMQPPVSARDTECSRSGRSIQVKVHEAQLYGEADPSHGLRRRCFYMRSH